MATTSRATVSLVGAGPGDPGLLTLRAAQALARADVLLYDALVADPVLARVPASCERIFVGKRGGNHAMPQPEIEALMIREARRGRRVVRLKGGDPFVFGRGAEEAEALRAAGIEFEIVPGITSAIAAPAYAGIPLTHRAHNVAFTVATGHEDPTKAASALDWEKLADPHRTLVFLMASAHLAEVARKLVAHGLVPSTPAAVVQDGTRPTQRTVEGTLESIADAAARENVGPPAVLVVGDVVRLRDRIRWFDDAPLFGKRVLVTRPAARAQEFAEALLARGAEPIVAPVLTIEPPDDVAATERAIDELHRYRWLALTSRHGVEALFDRLAARGADARFLGGVKVAAIGPKTEARLERYGVRADLRPAEFVGEAVARALIAVASPGDRVLIYRAQEARDALPRMLADAGLEPAVVAAYRTAVADDPAFAKKTARADVVTFTSAGAVRAFASLLGGNARAAAAAAGKTVACIGPIAAQAASEAGLCVAVVAGSYTAEGLIEALEAHFAAPS
jgi:uroporphyrinogen III methyltransferase / synthase